jgi:hypothetical protein
MGKLWVEEEVCGAWGGRLQLSWLYNILQQRRQIARVWWFEPREASLCGAGERRGAAICGAALALDVAPRAAAVMPALCLIPTRFIRASFCTICCCISQTAIYRHATGRASPE